MIDARNHLKRTGRLSPVHNAPGQRIGELYAFCGMVARAFSRLPSPAQTAVRQRFLGALKDNNGIAPLAFEMRTIAHFMAKGLDVEFHDLCELGGYDFLITNSQVAIEVECKSVSGDLGHRVHLLRQYQLGPFIFQAMQKNRKPGIVQLLVATLADRLHSQRQFMEAVGARICQALTQQTNLNGYEPCSVSYGEFPIQDSPFDCPSPPLITESEVAEYCTRIVGAEIGHTIMTFSPRRSATVIALMSAKPDQFLGILYKNLKDAAASQLTGKRPGAICVQLRNLTSTQLRVIAETPSASGKPTGVQLMMAKFFDSDARSHVHTVAFVAPGDFVAQQSIVADASGLRRDTIIGEDAVSYFFTNKRNSEINNPAFNVFG